MKRTLLGLLVATSLVACNTGHSGKVLPEGTYSRESTDEFGKLWQDLTLKKGEGENVYTVKETSRIRQRKLDDTVLLPETLKEETFIGNYDPDKQLLKVGEDGKVYMYNAEAKTLGNGTVTFTRK